MIGFLLFFGILGCIFGVVTLIIGKAEKSREITAMGTIIITLAIGLICWGIYGVVYTERPHVGTGYEEIQNVELENGVIKQLYTVGAETYWIENGHFWPTDKYLVKIEYYGGWDHGIYWDYRKDTTVVPKE